MTIIFYIIVAILSTWLFLIITKGVHGYVDEEDVASCILLSALWIFIWPLMLFLWLYRKFSGWILEKINGEDNNKKSL